MSRHQEAAFPCVVKTLGAISNPMELATIELTAEVFVYPSEDVTGEACPIGPMESMALGIPTIVSSLSCYDDYIQDGTNALKFKTGDVEDLQDTLRMLLSDRSLQMSLSRKAESIVQACSCEAVAKRYVRLFEDL